MSERAKGCDVSHWHPVFDWMKLAAAASFVGIKATDGEHFVDPTFGKHQRGFLGSPMKMAIYFHFAASGDPVVQARHFANVVGHLEPRERLCLDLERDITDLAWVDAFFRELMGNACAGSRPLIYTSERIWETLAGSATWWLASEVDLWLPRYSENEPKIPPPWSRWAFWQYSERGSMPGVDGQCDLNVFAGDDAALAAYVSTGVLPASPTTSDVA